MTDRSDRDSPSLNGAWGLAAHVENEAWISGFHRGQRRCRVQGRIVSLLNDERPDRKCDRAVKALAKRYAVRVIKKLP